MISYIKLPSSPLVSTGSVFASWVAFLDRGWVVVLVVLSAGLPEAKYATAAWVVRNQILVVHYSKLVRHLLGGERGVSLISNPWLTEVVHWDAIAKPNKVHSSQLCHSTSKTVSSCLNCRSRMNSLQSFHFIVNTINYCLLGFVKAFVYFAVALWKSSICGLCSG